MGTAKAMIGLDDLQQLLRHYSLVPDVSYRDREITMTLEPLGLVVSGATLDAAADAMLEELRQYTREYLERQATFPETLRQGDLPWILRFALTPLGAQRDLLFEEPASDSSPGHRPPSSSAALSGSLAGTMPDGVDATMKALRDEWDR